MATFIAYRPRADALLFANSTFCESLTLARSSSSISSRRSSESPDNTTTMCKTDFLDFVDLTTFHQDTPREYLALRELLEPMGHNPDNRDLRIEKDHSGSVTYINKVEASEEAEDNDEIDYESDTNDLPSLREIFAQCETEFGVGPGLGHKTFASLAPVKGASKECGREGDSEDSANPATTTITSVQPDASQGESGRSHLAPSIPGSCMLTYYSRQSDCAGR